jgi:beta-glucanase (GH16 family)
MLNLLAPRRSSVLLVAFALFACQGDPATEDPSGSGGGAGGGGGGSSHPMDPDPPGDPSGDAGGGGGGGGGDVEADAGADPDDPDVPPDPPSCVDGYRLVWADEFDGPSIDASHWEHEVNGTGGGNNELQYYTDRSENSRIEDGVLILEARQESYTGPDGTRQYTSARLRTYQHADFLYGRVEARIKLPQGQGLWPAFWMLPTDWVYGGWAASGEIDIMELLGQDPSRVYGTLHYGGAWPNNTHTGSDYVLPSGSFADDFHVFAIEWEESEFRWYVDGNLYETQNDWYSDAAAYPAPFDQRFHILLNVAVGGNWPGAPNGSTTFPQRMSVDWVRVHERCDG